MYYCPRHPARYLKLPAEAPPSRRFVYFITVNFFVVFIRFYCLPVFVIKSQTLMDNLCYKILKFVNSCGQSLLKILWIIFVQIFVVKSQTLVDNRNLRDKISNSLNNLL